MEVATQQEDQQWSTWLSIATAAIQTILIKINIISRMAKTLDRYMNKIDTRLFCTMEIPFGWFTAIDLKLKSTNHETHVTISVIFPTNTLS